MKILQGKGISAGICSGRLLFYTRAKVMLNRRHIEDVESEIGRYMAAKELALKNLAGLYEKALGEVGEQEAEIFQIHQMMLEEPDYEASILDIIRREQVSAEYAVGQTADKFAGMFAEMEDDYMRARAADVRDVSEKLIHMLLNGGSGHLIETDEPVILVADDLLPSETVQLDKSKLLGFAFLHGSSNSHTAILARTMNIPEVIHLEGLLDESCSGKNAILDGSAGTVYLEPDAKTAAEMQQLRETQRKHRALLEQLKGKESVTKDGQRMRIYANIGRVEDAMLALQNDAEGVGLFRSEFLYLESKDYPTEEEQFKAYKAALEAMQGRLVIIRTLDIGADKQADYFKLPKEENPALGFRAIRICLKRPELFKTQLRALFRASAFGKLGIMFPMIASVWEVRRIKETVEAVKAELTRENVKFADDVELGIMVETPAAALVSDDLAREVDFFSIGSNDLTQYTLAIDRQNQNLDSFCDTHHKAVLRLIKLVVENAHRHGIWAGICGELGADTSLTETFLAIGVDELSVSPPQVLEVRSKVRECEIRGSKADLLDAIDR